MTGADADGLDRLAKLFDDAATSLLSSQKLIRTRLVNSPWDGRDAHAFRSDWERSHKPSLMSTAQYLRDAGNTLRRNATEQRRASAAESRLVSGIKD
ncbi:MAG: WXG100 family type VII secretion target, partial [Ilumatobacteraceae bacterium]